METRPARPPTSYALNPPHGPINGMLGATVAKRFYLIRHGETDSNVQVMTSSTGEAITEKQEAQLTRRGLQQAVEVGKLLNSFDLDVSSCRIACSSMQRARLTYLYAEVNAPKIQDLPFFYIEELREKERTETLSDFRSRIERIKERLLQDPGNTVLVFAHSLVISQMLGMDPMTDFHLTNGSVSIMDITTDGRKHIHVVNYTDHLTHITGGHTCLTNNTDVLI